MSSDGETKSSRRGQTRVLFEGEVRLRYRLFQEFLEENAANISTGGMFICTTQPGEPGSELDFEIRLEDDFTLIQGRGEVAWVRRAGQQPGAEAGMGIRFVELAEESQGLVDKIVRERVKAGLELFDLEAYAPAETEPEKQPEIAASPAADDTPIWELEPAADAPQPEPPPVESPPAAEPAAAAAQVENLAALDPEVPRPSAPVASAPARSAVAAGRPKPFRLIAVAVVSALVGAGAVLTFYWFYVQPSIDSLETRIDELAGNPMGPWQPPAEEPAPVRDAASRAGAAEESPVAVSTPGRSDDVVSALRGWAAAWTEQRTDDYLACYSSGFVPPDGLDRAAWEAARRARIARPEWIRVALTLVQVETTGPDTAEVGFVQSYRSERYKDLVRKRVSMVFEDGGWKIAAERALP